MINIIEFLHDFFYVIFSLLHCGPKTIYVCECCLGAKFRHYIYEGKERVIEVNSISCLFA